MTKVKVYSTPTCPYCTMAKDFLKDLDVEFEDIDVAEDHEAAKEMVEKSGQMGVPVIVIGDEVIVGFNKPAIEKALEKSKK
jgi:glutaredoxin 3